MAMRPKKLPKNKTPVKSAWIDYARSSHAALTRKVQTWGHCWFGRGAGTRTASAPGTRLHLRARRLLKKKKTKAKEKENKQTKYKTCVCPQCQTCDEGSNRRRAFKLFSKRVDAAICNFLHVDRRCAREKFA